MDRSRRRFVLGCGIGALGGLSGCMEPFQQKHAPVVAVNASDEPRVLSMSATSPPDDGDVTEHFSRTVTVPPDEDEQFEEALEIGDYRPDELFAMAVLDDGTSVTGTRIFPQPDGELRFEITERGEIDIWTVAPGV